MGHSLIIGTIADWAALNPDWSVVQWTKDRRNLNVCVSILPYSLSPLELTALWVSEYPHLEDTWHSLKPIQQGMCPAR